jgi:hypothetical protein
MKYFLAIALLLCLSSSCKKDDKNQYDGYVCVWGISKVTLQRTFIRCEPREIYLCGYNQTAADNISTSNGYQHYDVTIMKNYTNWEGIPTTTCNCQ